MRCSARNWKILTFIWSSYEYKQMSHTSYLYNTLEYYRHCNDICQRMLSPMSIKRRHKRRLGRENEGEDDDVMTRLMAMLMKLVVERDTEGRVGTINMKEIIRHWAKPPTSRLTPLSAFPRANSNEDVCTWRKCILTEHSQWESQEHGLPPVLKTLYSIVEAPLKKKSWTLMSVLYDDVQMDQ